MYHFFVDKRQITTLHIYITGADYKHMKKVLRLKIGDTVLVSEKAEQGGRNFVCSIEGYTDTEAMLTIQQSDVADNELPCKVTLFQGLPKSDKMELIIQKSVELGVYDVVPVAMKNCVVKLEEKKSEERLKRWNAISESAAKQSKRSRIPKVHGVMSYKGALEIAAEYDVVLVPYENEKGMAQTRSLIGAITPGCRVAVFIGPEGGFSEEEIALVREKNMSTISLGKRILRTETAGPAVLAMIAYALEE